MVQIKFEKGDRFSFLGKDEETLNFGLVLSEGVALLITGVGSERVVYKGALPKGALPFVNDSQRRPPCDVMFAMDAVMAACRD